MRLCGTDPFTNGNVVRSISGLGLNPSGFDVDVNGDVYVAVTSSNQVWKFDPTTTSFAPDTNFGFGGFIGMTNGLSSTNDGAFNAPFGVSVLPNGGQVSVSDSGNNRIEQFDLYGNFQDSFGSFGSSLGQFDAPKGLAYDDGGTLHVVDSGNNRIVLAQGTFVISVSGTNGTGFGQFNGPLNINFGDHGGYIADTGNNRIESFSSPAADFPFTADPSAIRFSFSTNFNEPAAIAAMDDNLTTEKYWVADTGNNRVVLYTLASDNPQPPWTNFFAHVASGDTEGAPQGIGQANIAKFSQI